MEAGAGSAGSQGPDPALTRERAHTILAAQIAGLERLAPLCDSPALARAVGLFRDCRGRILVSGVGKSGLVAAKIAASMRSTGTPAVYLHPVDAMHGDVGLVGPEDVGFFLSKSGESRELTDLVPTFKRLGVGIVCLVTRSDCTLAGLSDLILDIGPVVEAGPVQEVPTTSTTVFQVVGDLLTLLVLWEKGLTSEDFAFLHPGGVLGRLTTLRVREIMHQGEALPRVRADARVRDALVEMIDKRLGMTTVVDEDGRLVGVLTDGDIRRILHRYGSIEELKILQVMSGNPKTIDGEQLLASAVHRMETNAGGPITSLVVVDAEGRPDGVIHLHDCLRLGMRNGAQLA
jgi:arabinose-5-phosphate isomerase